MERLGAHCYWNTYIHCVLNAAPNHTTVAAYYLYYKHTMELGIIMSDTHSHEVDEDNLLLRFCFSLSHISRVHQIHFTLQLTVYVFECAQR